MDFPDDQMRGGGDNGNWAKLFDPTITYTSSFNTILNNMPDTTMMVEDSGYVILRQAVFQEHVEKAEQDTNAQEPMKTTDRLVTYHFTSSARELVDELRRYGDRLPRNWMILTC